MSDLNNKLEYDAGCCGWTLQCEPRDVDEDDDNGVHCVDDKVDAPFSLYLGLQPVYSFTHTA